MTLVRHWMTRWDRSLDDGVYRQEHLDPATDPSIPDGPALEWLRANLAQPAAEPIGWWHRDGNAWDAVVRLHQRGLHGHAEQLARLLRWCDQSFPFGPGEGSAYMWQLVPAGYTSPRSA